jgi:pyrroloquinoline-quinone synthase
MHEIIEVLNQKIQAKHLLKHPFYVAWSNGNLTLKDLQLYACQYFAHVRAFPVYLSEMHSRCEDLDSRRIIAANLADEEARQPTHPELWLDFAEGLGVSRESVVSSMPGARITALIDTYRAVARMETGIAAAGLYCYEKQIPAVSAAKIAGLKERYGIDDPRTLQYFRVHESADVEHATQWESILQRQPLDARKASQVADAVLGALWGALDGIYSGCAAAMN